MTPSAPITAPQRPSAPKRVPLHIQYAHPLPIVTYNLPLISLDNPITLLPYLYHFAKLAYNSIVAKPAHQFHFKATFYSRNVILVETGEHMRTLWEMGFFGKGTLSRSEPTWLGRTHRRLGIFTEESLSPEEVTALRRKQRADFKQLRAQVDALIVDLRRQVDQGLISVSEMEKRVAEAEAELARPSGGYVDAALLENEYRKLHPADLSDIRAEDSEIVGKDGKIRQLESLQLMPCEAFFLNYALRVLTVSNSGGQILPSARLFRELCREFRPEDSFIVSYVAYHHYRSLGWCVRSGVKFGTDFLLYNRGPPFSHAEFALVLIPVSQNSEEANEKSAKRWWWNTNIARVVAGAKKTLVFCYVEYPSDITRFVESDGGVDLPNLLRAYKVTEVVYRRWVPNRNRD